MVSGVRDIFDIEVLQTLGANENTARTTYRARLARESNESRARFNLN